MIIILVPVLVAVLGCLVYALSSNAKVAELGRLLFFCGALVSTSVAASHTWKI